MNPGRFAAYPRPLSRWIFAAALWAYTLFLAALVFRAWTDPIELDPFVASSSGGAELWLSRHLGQVGAAVLIASMALGVWAAYRAFRPTPIVSLDAEGLRFRREPPIPWSDISEVRLLDTQGRRYFVLGLRGDSLSRRTSRFFSPWGEAARRARQHSLGANAFVMPWIGLDQPPEAIVAAAESARRGSSVA